MVKRNVIVRKLDSLEALGAVTDICSDKTGTLTQGVFSLEYPSNSPFLASLNSRILH